MEHMPHDKKRYDKQDHPLSQWFSNFSEADELLKLAAARQQVRFTDSSICLLEIYTLPGKADIWYYFPTRLIKCPFGRAFSYRNFSQ
jgi:YEATS domain-containing protein 4